MPSETDELKLTAYALGELDEADVPSVEALLASDPAARAFVDDTRRTAAHLTRGLAAEQGANASLQLLTAGETRRADDARPRLCLVPGDVSPRTFWSRRAAYALAATLVVGLATIAILQSRKSHSDPIANRSGKQGGNDAPGTNLVVIPFAQGGGSFPVAHDTAAHRRFADNPFQPVADASTCALPFGVGTASYNTVRTALLAGTLPPADGVRVEELVNYFPYRDPAPAADAAIAARVEIAACPWAPAHRLARVGLRAKDGPAPAPDVPALVVATHVTVQLRLNPRAVASYRLIGFEKRGADPAPDAAPRRTPGDVAAGQTMTALIEYVPASSESPFTVALAYRLPGTAATTSHEVAAADPGLAFPAASEDFRFAAAVAEFGLLLQRSPHRADASYARALATARAACTFDPGARRAEFLDLIHKAATLSAAAAPSTTGAQLARANYSVSPYSLILR